MPYAVAVLGAFILAFGLYNVHARAAITEGGVLGLTLFFKHWLGISPSISGFVLDAICYLIGFRLLGRAFAKFAIVSSVAFALSYAALEQFPAILPNLSGSPLLAALAGGAFVGIGVGMVVRQGGACGGDDALALSISKASGLPIARAYLFTDLIVLALSLTYIPFKNIMFSLISVTLSSFIIGQIQAFDLGKIRRKTLKAAE